MSTCTVWTRDEWETALRLDYAGIRGGQRFGLYLGEGGTTWGPVIIGDVFCCDGRATSDGAACDDSCEHEHHTAEGRMACGDCGRPIVYDHDREDFRHLEDPEHGCFLIPDEFVLTPCRGCVGCGVVPDEDDPDGQRRCTSCKGWGTTCAALIAKWRAAAASWTGGLLSNTLEGVDVDVSVEP